MFQLRHGAYVRKSGSPGHMLESVFPEIDEWISSNTCLFGLLNTFNHEYSGDVAKGKDDFARLLSCITNAPNLQPLGCYHALRFWDEFLTKDERERILISLRDSDIAVQKMGITDIYALFKLYIPIVDPPLPFAVPVWKLFVEWPDGQWQDMAQRMDEHTLHDTLPGLSCKIRSPTNINDHDSDLIPMVFSHLEGQDVSVDVAKDVHRHLQSIKDGFWSRIISNSDKKDNVATSFRSFFSSPIFEDRGKEACQWRYDEEECACPIIVYFYPVKHANAWVRRKIIILDWYVADTNFFPVIIANAVSNPWDYGEYQVCYQAIALLYIARTAITENTVQVRRVSVMALYISHTGVKRYIFSFSGSQPQKIQYWYKYYDFGKLKDLGMLWLELWNSRTILPQQFGDFDFGSWLGRFASKHRHLLLYPYLTSPSTSVIYSRPRSRSQCVDTVDQERRKNRVAWLNSQLREFKFRVDKFIHANVVRIVHWTTQEVVEYAKFFPADSYELSIHHYLLSLSEHPNNRTVPILRLLEDPEGCSVAFIPSVGDRLSPPSTINKTLDIALQICHAVDFMHQHGIAHLDLKMENIILSFDGRITIIDFSCAYHIPPPPGLICESVGTPGYMAPEVEEGLPYDPVVADIYSLGWVLQLLCDAYFPSYFDMTKSMLAEDPLSRPPLSPIISRIESFIAEPSLWEYLDINLSTESLV